MASKGQAMDDGSFPIANEEDLKNAIQAYGRAKNKSKAKEHIIKRARTLGATSLLPDDWETTTASGVIAAPHTPYTYDESKHKRDEDGMFAPKDGGSSSSGRSGVERRRESGASFGERAYARAAEREAEKAAEKAGKRSGRGLTDAERAARKAEREAEKAKREAERAAKEAERRQRQIDLANHKYKDKRIPPGFARKMVDAMKQTPQAGISSVADAEKAADKAGTLPFSGPEKIAFIDYLKDRMPASRLQVFEDGSGWYLDNTGRLYRIPADDDYVKNG